jgi:hypothetical protein
MDSCGIIYYLDDLFSHLYVSIHDPSKGVFSWFMPPDVAFIRELLMAYTLAFFGTPDEWRALTYRSRIVLHLGSAASILEGPMLHIFERHANGTASAISRRNLSVIAAGPGDKIVWLATPKVDTQEHLARALGETLVVALTGNLDRLLNSEIVAVTRVPLSWQSQVLGIGRWAVLAVGPALALFVAWNFIGKI